MINHFYFSASLQHAQEIIKYLYKWSVISQTSPSVNLGNPSLTAVREPLGVVVIELSETMLYDIIIAAVACGNTVIVINKAKDQDLLQNLCKVCSLPPGVFNVVSHKSQEVMGTLKGHQEVSAIFSVRQSGKYVKVGQETRSRDLTTINYNCSCYVFKEITKIKCIWNSIGESFL